MSHKCPAPDCPARVADHMLMCRPHWYQVPRDLRNDVWAAWDNGMGAGTPEHNEAIIAAIESLRARQR
jgi:hypothetical protein